MPDAYSPLSAVVTWGPSLLPLRIEGADDQGRPALVDAPAEVLAGDVPGAYTFRTYEDPDLPWPTRRISMRFVPGSEADVALRRRLRQIEEARL